MERLYEFPVTVPGHGIKVPKSCFLKLPQAFQDVHKSFYLSCNLVSLIYIIPWIVCYFLNCVIFVSFFQWTTENTVICFSISWLSYPKPRKIS